MTKVDSRFVPAWVILFTVAVSTACEGPTGPPGPAGSDTDPSISGISPRSAFLEHPADVTISGSGTAWSSSATVDFGEGVTVSNVSTASPTALIATIEAARTAVLGTRSVTVTDEGVETVFTDGFELAAPLALEALDGTVAQGSLALVEVRQRDLGTPFNARSTGGEFESVRYPYLATFMEGHGRNGVVTNASDFRLSARLTVDVFAQTGPTPLVVESESSGQVTPSVLPGAVDVAERSPADVTPGTSVTGTVTDAFQSFLYSATASAGRLVTVDVSTSSSAADPILVHLPESGSFADQISQTTRSQFVAGDISKTHYFVYVDGEQNTGYDISVGVEDYATSSEVEANDDPGTANNLTGAILGAVGAVGDQDYFAVSATTGQTIMVSSGSGINDPCPEVDPELEIYDTDGTTSLAFADNTSCDAVSASVASDGTYFVRVGPSADFCADCTFDYSLLIEVQ